MSLAADIRAALALRDRLAAEFPFGEPARNILLDLALCRLEERRVSVTSACIASGAPWTTALRYIDQLVASGLVHREPHPDDARSFLMTIADEPFARIAALFGKPALRVVA